MTWSRSGPLRVRALTNLITDAEAAVLVDVGSPPSTDRWTPCPPISARGLTTARPAPD
jgi:hypothetical protein